MSQKRVKYTKICTYVINDRDRDMNQCRVKKEPHDWKGVILIHDEFPVFI